MGCVTRQVCYHTKGAQTCYGSGDRLLLFCPSEELVTLARDQVGNHTLQSLLKHCTAEQLGVALPILFRVDSIVELSCDQFSNHVLQQYLQQAPAEFLVQGRRSDIRQPPFIIENGVIELEIRDPVLCEGEPIKPV